jgi:hypothetical protein
VLILDDILLAPFTAPFKGLLWTARKIQEAAKDELESRSTRTRSELSELYMQLETGKITEEEFDEREKRLLDRLDQLKAAQQRAAAQPSAEEAPAEEEVPAENAPTEEAPAEDARVEEEVG